MRFTYTGTPKYGKLKKIVRAISDHYDSTKGDVIVEVDALVIPDRDGVERVVRFFGDIEGTTLHLYSNNRKKIRSYDLTKPHTFFVKEDPGQYTLKRVW